jgi:hypothetical protein
MPPDNGYAPFRQLLDEIGKAFDADATVAALAMVYVGIDTMALLACPVGQVKQGRSDFIAWVNRYLKADANSAYQYDGVAVYAARCGLLHAYGSESDFHRGQNPPPLFGYTDNGPHRADSAEPMVLISIAVLIRDFSAAVLHFIQEMLSDPDLKARVDSRISAVLVTQMLSP